MWGPEAKTNSVIPGLDPGTHGTTHSSETQAVCRSNCPFFMKRHI